MMSVAGKKEISVKEQSRKCAGRFWRLFPHLLLCLSLVAYAVLGALIFEHIEGKSTFSFQADYHDFLGQIIRSVQNLTKNASSSHEEILKEVETKMLKFNAIWFQRPERWNFFGAMFFCCTVFTTVGYGEIYPVTLTGKVVCVLYAMVGIPLMLLVILDVGDFLAMLMSRAYMHIYTLRKILRSNTWSPWNDQKSARHSSHRDFFHNQDIVIHEPLDIRQVLHSQADVRQKSIKLQNNQEIFEKILARDHLLRKTPLLRTLSCPELERLPTPPKGFAIWDFTGLGDEMEMLNVPFVLILFIVFAYILFVGLILPLWEKDLKGFDPYYFCFITLTTIGFGDIMPCHPKFFMLTSLFLIVGMAIMSMAFKLSQTRIVSCYSKCIKFISRGNVETFQKLTE